MFKCAVVALTINASQAATINVGQGFGTNVGVIASTSNDVVLSGGGYYIAVGSYTIVPTVLPVGTDGGASLLAAVNSFNIFAAATAPTAAGATQGSIVGAFTSDGSPDPSLFNLKNIFFLIGNGATKAASTEWGIFSVATTFPANVAVSGATAVTVGSFSSFTPLANAGTAIDQTGAKDNFKLVNPIPEPSVVFLGAIGFLGLLRRRRI